MDTSNRWVVRPILLRFNLGEVTLFSVRFKLAVLDAHFTELGENEFCTWPGWEGVPSSAEGALVRSQPIGERLPRLTATPDAIRYVPAQYQRYYMEFQSSFEGYLQKFSSKIRGNRKREIKKFAEMSGGTIDWREYRAPGEIEEFLGFARALSAKTFQERLLDAGLPAGEEYRRDLLALAAKDKLRAYLLFHAGQPVAYLLTEVRDPDILLYRYLGYDPAFRSWSPGTVLHFKAFEKLFAEGGLRMLDFTEGEGTHKKFFATGSKLCADIYFFRGSLKNRLILRSHALLDAVSRRLTSLLDRIGLKARLKKFIRSRA